MSKTQIPSIRFRGFDDAWEQRKLGEVIRLNGRIGFRGYTEKDIVSKDDGGVLTFSPTNIVDNKLTTNCKNTYITRFKYDESPEIKIHNGDILFVKTGSTLGKSALVTGLSEDATLNPQVVVMRTNNLNVEFLAAMLVTNAIISQVNSAKIGGAVPTLTETRIKDFDVAIPVSEAEKEQIGQFFSQLDHLITLHQRKFEKLTNVKKSMLEKMFPRNGSCYPEIRFKGFTDPWEQCKLGDISEIKTGPFGSTLHADDYVSDGTPIITTEHFKTGALPRSKNGLPQVSDSDYKRLTAYTLDAGDIVFSRVGSVDINGIITPFQSNWLFSGRVLRVRPQTDVLSQFLHTRLETESIKTDIRTRAVGQTMPSINTEILKITPLVLPSSAAEQEQIGSYFAALDNLITLHQRELEKLQSIKKALLEKMFV